MAKRKLYTVPSNIKTGGRVGGGTFTGTPVKGYSGPYTNAYKPKLRVRPVQKNINKGRGPGRPKGSKNKPKLTYNTTDFGTGHKNVTAANATRHIYHGPEKYETEQPPITPGLTHGDKMTVMTSNTMSLKITAVGVGKQKIFRTQFETGTPTTKPIKTLKSMSGNTKNTLVDTKWWTNVGSVSITGGVPVPRLWLDHAHGFNAKKWWFMPGAASPSYLDLFESIVGTRDKATITQWLDGRTLISGTEKKYASFVNFKTMMTFMNESTHLPIKMKVMYIVPTYDLKSQSDTIPTYEAGNRLSYLLDLRENVFNTTDGSVNQEDFALPMRYQLSTPQLEALQESPFSVTNPVSDNYRLTSFKVDVANRTRLTMSAWFRDKFKIMKSFTKTLDPNDVWHVSHTHHMGSGLDVDEARSGFIQENQLTPSAPLSVQRVGNDRPLVGFWMVESMGVPCVATVGDQTITGPGNQPPTLVPTSYQGTSNGNYHCEFKTEIEFVGSFQNASIIPGTFGVPENVHMRTFKKRDSSANILGQRPRFILPADIVTDKAALEPGKAYINVLSDQTYALNTTKNHTVS